MPERIEARLAVGKGLWDALRNAPRGRAGCATQAFLASEEARYPLLAEMVEISGEAGLTVIQEFKEWRARKRMFFVTSEA